MATAFLGYVIPYGQMSYWGATVITKFLSVIPFLGSELVTLVWGSFSVDSPTLTRFFMLHYLLPFIIRGSVVLHLLFLHLKGSNNPLQIKRDSDKIVFHPFFTIKDVLGCCFFFLVFILFFSKPIVEPQKFIEANPLVTPPHIQPEWYFLGAYAVLRAIPRKAGGVICLILFILFWLLPSITFKKFKNKSVIFGFLVGRFFILTIIGAYPVEDPYVYISQICTAIYFICFLFNVGVFCICNFGLQGLNISSIV